MIIRSRSGSPLTVEVKLTERQQLALLMRKTEEEALTLNVNKRNASGEYPLHTACIKVGQMLAVPSQLIR